MKGKMKYFVALATAFVMALCGIMSLVKPQNAYAAEYSYQAARDGYELTDDGKLKVTFTVSSMESGLSSNLIKWGVYLIDENTGITYNTTTHKYTDNNSRQRNVASYYFLINPSDSYDTNGNQVTSNHSGTYTIYVDPSAIAYHATSGPSSASDFGTNTGKTMDDVLHEKNWIIGVGPMFANWWGSSGYGAPIDYYVGRQAELVVAKVYFRDFDGTLITEKKYSDKTSNVDTTNVAADANKVFTGWYCDTTKEIYQNLNAVQQLTVSNLMTNTNTVNFYATYQRGNGEYIEFTPVAEYVGNYTQNSENDTILLDEADDDTTFTVTYKITHNDGVNSILLLPEYDTSKFSIVSVDVDNETALGTATLTNNGFDKILLESEDLYNGLNDTFITITFNIDTPVDGDYRFGLKLAPYVHNEVSEAYFYNTTELGEQEEMDIRVINTNNLVRVLTLKQAEVKIGYNHQYGNDNYYAFTYSGSPVDVERLVFDTAFNTSATKVEYEYSGTATPVVKWYSSNNGTRGEELNEDPYLAGEYFVGVSAEADGVYYAVSETYRRVVIAQNEVNVVIENKTSVYGESIVELTYQGDYDYLNIQLYTTATSLSNIGEYEITGTYSNSQYIVHFVTGTYTITARPMTITALHQEAEYTGSEPEVSQTEYTAIDGITNEEIALGLGVVTIVKEAGVNVGNYALTISADGLPNHNVTYVHNTFTIKSQGANTAYFEELFVGLTQIYNANQQDLLQVSENFPNWATYVATNNLQTNVGTYDIGITVNVSAENAANFTNGVTQFVLGSVEGKINPYGLTITAENKTSQYGQTPVALTPTTVDGLGEDVINVTFTVKDGNETITLTAETGVGEYDIVPFATNSNYSFTFVNGVYTITKATPVITVSAEGVYYNRDLVYSSSVAINTLSLNNYTVVIKDSNNEVVDTNTVLDAGTYTVVVSVAGTDNYNSATNSAQFVISKIALANPVVSYNNATATWTAVVNDAGAENVDAKALYNSTLTYAINNVAQDGLTYTASSKDALILTVSSSNENYLPAQVNLANVYKITFNEGTHTASDATVENMPADQYRFAGQTANEPLEVPTLVGYTFSAWDYDFATLVNEDKTVVALWDINTLTMTVVYIENVNFTQTSRTFTVNYNDEVAISTYNLKLQTGLNGDNDNMATEYDLAGMHYVFGNLWNYKVTGANEYIDTEVHQVPVNATTNLTFVAVYTSSPINYVLTYKVSENGGEYAQYQVVEDIPFGSEIEYINLSGINWFRADYWFADEDRNALAPATMPAGNLTVYGAIVFNIGQGDVNADGSVDTNDITLYRQWIVGGYEMTVVANGSEWTAAQNFNGEVRYFLAKVADNNADTSRDIRDISITRMAIVGGYDWDIDTGVNVSGNEIIRNVQAKTLNDVYSALSAGKKATLANNITEAEGLLEISTNHNLYINLNGKTLTVQALRLTVTNNSTITIKNGTIVTTDGITISAPNGNVVLTNVTGYDKDGEVNLATANHSLHINGLVKFNKGTTTENTPAAVKVADGTHVVVEQAANLVVEKLVVAVVTNEVFVPTLAEDVVITIDNFSAVAEEIVVEGNVEKNNEIYTREDLVAAAANGGSYTLMADLSYSGVANRVYFYEDTVLDLNGHTITSTNEIPLAVLSGATLTINGNGYVNGVEGCVMAFGNASFVINGGTYTCTDNFVFGTNGSTGKGGNTITINAGTFNGQITSAGYVACGIYVANADTVVVNGGTFNITNGVGILARSGNTTVKAGVVFNVSGNGELGKVGDSQVTVPSGEELVLDLKANYPGGTPTLNNNTTYEVYTVENNVA